MRTTVAAVLLCYLILGRVEAHWVTEGTPEAPHLVTEETTEAPHLAIEGTPEDPHLVIEGTPEDPHPDIEVRSSQIRGEDLMDTSTVPLMIIGILEHHLMTTTMGEVPHPDDQPSCLIQEAPEDLLVIIMAHQRRDLAHAALHIMAHLRRDLDHHVALHIMAHQMRGMAHVALQGLEDLKVRAMDLLVLGALHQTHETEGHHLTTAGLHQTTEGLHQATKIHGELHLTPETAEGLHQTLGTS